MSRSRRLFLTNSFAALLEKFRYEAGPTGLMACANAGAIVAVKVFVEGDQIAPGRIGLEFCGGAENRPLLVRVSQEDARESF